MVIREAQLGDEDGEDEGDTAWERVQGDLHLQHPELHQQYQHQLQQLHLRVQLRRWPKDHEHGRAFSGKQRQAE